MSEEDFYRTEWKREQKKGNTEYAETCKEMYRMLLMDSLEKPYTFRDDRLKQFPMIILN